MTTNHAHDAFLGRADAAARPFVRLEDGSEWTHGAFAARAARLQSVLEAAGVEPGDRIAVQVAKHPDALALYAASLRGGFVFLPLNTAYTAAELSHFLADSEAALTVCDEGTEDEVAPVAARAGGRAVTLAALTEGLDAAPEADARPRGPDDLAAILYTSGTTGRSKGAMLTHANLVSNARALVEAWRFTEGDVLIHALPVFHTHGLFVGTNVTLLAGASMIFQARFDPGAVLAAMPGATVLMGVPTFYTRLLEHPGLTPERAANMRLFVSGSAPMLAETHRAWRARTGHSILERYGMTETNMNTSNPYDGERRAGTVGMPLPGVELRLTGEDGGPVGEGRVGAIEVRGPNVFRGYWRMPEKTAAEFREDGWFVTGDMGQLSGDGYLTIVGREKDLVISGGFNVYPAEVEDAIDRLPGVLESAVIGLPHADLGEAVTAVVVREGGTDVDEAAIVAGLRDSLARYKQPKRVLFAEELPRNTMGKVLKAELRREHAGLYE